jgi:hemerythrin-like metal-binding protein
MPLLVFTEKFSVGIETIDQQHRRLFEILNNLFEAMKFAQGKHVLETTLAELNEYTQYHFSAEENLLDKFGYPQLNGHRSEHAFFIRRIITFQEDLKRGKPALSVYVMNFLKSWITNHILIVDKKYSGFLIENGMK